MQHDARHERGWQTIFRALPAHLMLVPKVVRIMQQMKSGEVISNGELCSLLHENRDVVIFACNLIEASGWCARTHNAEGLIAWKPTDKLPTFGFEFASDDAAELHLMLAAAMWGQRVERIRSAA